MMESYLAHYGIKGQKYGVRRFQNEDGSLTEAGKKRYGVNTDDMRGILGDKYQDVANKIAAMQAKTGRTELTADECREILGDDFDRVTQAVAAKQAEYKKAEEADKAAGTDKTATENKDLQEDSIEAMAYKVMRGDYGNGAQRKEALGENYAAIQAKVNELMKGNKSAKATATDSEAVKKAQKDYDKAKKKEQSLVEDEDRKWKTSEKAGGGSIAEQEHRIAMAKLQNQVKDSNAKEKTLNDAKSAAQKEAETKAASTTKKKSSSKKKATTESTETKPKTEVEKGIDERISQMTDQQKQDLLAILYKKKLG